ncbi:MAG TPA: glycosyltransferase family A protein [Polyangiaceae bacterium]|nr:glycosyltransferase family A protein [Polyangiaceae bacterium]
MSAPSGADVCVCLLTYDHAAIVESTLDSVLAQNLAGFELIVSDDGSTDGTWEIIARRAAADARINAVRTPQNLGMAGNANFAARRSTRPFLALLHHDDLYRPDLLEKWLGVMQRQPDVSFVFNPYAVHAEARVMGHPFSDERLDGARFLEQHLFPRWGCPVRGTAMIRRRDFDAVGGLREEFGLLADVDLWMRLAARGAVGYVPEPLVSVRQERPAYYPEAYQGTSWSWRRQRYLYDIHARNRLEWFDQGTWRGRLELLEFRTRLSLETAKWLSYALARRKWSMLDSADDSITLHDQPWLSAYRSLLGRALRAARAAKGERSHG